MTVQEKKLVDVLKAVIQQKEAKPKKKKKKDPHAKNKAFKYRLFPTEEQALLIRKTFGCARFVYNKMLAERIDTYKRFKDNEELLKKQKEPTPAKYKSEFKWLKEVDSLALANAQMNLKTAYNNFFKKLAEFPKFKNKKARASYTTNAVNGNILVLNGHVKLPKLGLVKMKQHREIPKSHTIKSCTISMNAQGHYHISILTEYIEEIKPKTIKTVVGLDFSMAELFVTSENEKANYPRFYRQALEKLAEAQRRLARRKKGSARWNKQRIRVAKLHAKVSAQRKHFLHCESKKLANTFDAVGIEDLNMQEMGQTMNFGKSVADNGWGMFTTFLNYKLEARGKKLVKVDKWFASSKTCSSCGKTKEMPLAERVYKCTCGLEIDRDHNAALNIKNETTRILALV